MILPAQIKQVRAKKSCDLLIYRSPEYLSSTQTHSTGVDSGVGTGAGTAKLVPLSTACKWSEARLCLILMGASHACLVAQKVYRLPFCISDKHTGGEVVFK